jgi:hypothetical protein
MKYTATVLLLADRRRSPAAKFLRDSGFRLLTTFTPDHAVALCVNSNDIRVAVLDQEHFVTTDNWSVAQSLKMVRRNMCVVLVARGKIVGHTLPEGVDAIVAERDGASLAKGINKLLDR